MKTFFSAAVLTSCLLLTGCFSTPEVKPRMARFDSSEVDSNAFKFKLSVGSDSSNSIPRSDKEKADKGSSARVSAAMTLGHGVEIKYSNNGDDKYGIKYQFYGAPLEEKLTGNVSLATSLSYIRSSRWDTYGGYTDTPLSDDTSPVYNDYEWGLQHDTYDVALIGGYRVNPQTLLYGSLFYQDGDIKGEIRARAIRNVPTDECPEGQKCVVEYINSDGKAYGLNLGLEYEIKRWFVVTGEVVYHHAKWFERSNGETAANVNLEFRF